MTAALREVAEAAADAETAACYADIRQTLGTGAVNLVWRHLAIERGALVWVWRHARPLYAASWLDDAVARLQRVATDSALPRWTTRELRTVDVDADTLATVRTVLQHYHHSNPRNLLVLLAFMQSLNGGGESGTVAPRPPATERAASPQPRAQKSLPPLIKAADMSPATRAAALRLEALGAAAVPTEVVAGVPRHLAHWPGFLEFAVAALEEHEQHLLAMIGALESAARASGAHRLRLEAAAPSPACAEFVQGALARFTSRDAIVGYLAKIGMILSRLPV